MNCDGEYAGDSADKARKRVRVAGASGWVEFCDRQCSYPRISRGQLEGLDGLVEGGPGVAAVSIFRQRGIDEVKDVNVEVSGERARREMAQCGPGSPDPASCSGRPAERNAAGAKSWPAA